MIPGLLASALIAAASPYKPLDGEPAERVAVRAEQMCMKGKKVAVAPVSNEGIGNLPFAMGRRFRTLDDYLAHLECHAAPIDLPWWRQIRPEVYEHVKRLPGARREIATRAELMKRFGFSE